MDIRVIDTAEMKKRILATLEEAGFEDANALLNTVMTPSGNSDEPKLFEDALVALLEEGAIFVEIAGERWPRDWRQNDDGRALIERLADHYVYDSSEKIWRDSRYRQQENKVPSAPMVTLTEAGKAKSIELLEEHGYEWWRQPKDSSAILNDPKLKAWWDSRLERGVEADADPKTARHDILFQDAETGEVSPLSIHGAGLYAKIKAYLIDHGVIETQSSAIPYVSVFVISRQERDRFDATFRIHRR